jgi:CheY-like chemotaxis protein
MSSTSERATAFGKTPPLALVVEPDGALRALAERVLETLGCQPISAESAALARTMCEKRPRFAVLVIEAKLPDGDGYAVARELRRHLADRAPPIVLLSDRVDDGSTHPEGVAAIVAVPFTDDELRDVVKYAIDRGPARP